MTALYSAKCHENSEEVNDISLVLIGAQGSGKSSTGNTILAEKKFQVHIGTKESKEGRDLRTLCRTIKDTHITVIDTPYLTENYGLSDIHKSFRNTSGKNIIYAIIIAIGRFTPEEKEVIEPICDDARLKSNICFIFTRRNELKRYDCNNEKDAFAKWLKSAPTLQTYIMNHNFPYMLLENKEDTDQQKDQIENLVEELKHLLSRPRESMQRSRPMKCMFSYFDRVKKAG